MTISFPGRPDGDATNVPGRSDRRPVDEGSPSVGLAHLGDLAAIGLYLDDNQISRISYRELPAAEVSYRVRVSALRQQDLPE